MPILLKLYPKIFGRLGFAKKHKNQLRTYLIRQQFKNFTLPQKLFLFNCCDFYFYKCCANVTREARRSC